MNDFWHSFQGAALFFLLSHPDTYRYVSALVKQPIGSINLAAVHAVAFFIVSFLVMRLYHRRGTVDNKTDVVGTSWWYKP